MNKPVPLASWPGLPFSRFCRGFFTSEAASSFAPPSSESDSPSKSPSSLVVAAAFLWNGFLGASSLTFLALSCLSLFAGAEDLRLPPALAITLFIPIVLT